MIGYSFVRSNIVQINIDQGIGASDVELSAIIYWHSLVYLEFFSLSLLESTC